MEERQSEDKQQKSDGQCDTDSAKQNFRAGQACGCELTRSTGSDDNRQCHDAVVVVVVCQ